MLSTEPGGFIESPDGTLVHFIDLDLHAEALHTEVSDPVVLIHGLGLSWRHWSRQIGWLAHSRRVVAVDMRGGGGKTRWTTPGWTTADMAADVYAVVMQLGLRRPAIVGISMGGTIALQYTLEYPADISRLAVCATSLPETPGGARNWDYRFTWIRDSAFMLRSLYELGFGWEAIEYFGFIINAVSSGDRNGPFELQVMYGIGGERELTERTLDHLSGWRGARPVRVGNGAWNQRQHDVWGMILDAVDVQFRRNASQIEMPLWEGLAGFVQAALEHWREPDQGLWEVRGEPKHFTASKVMCWVAASRGADLARQRGDERAGQWQAGAEEIRAEVLEKGVSDRGVFRQHYETGDLDASLLLLVLMGFLPPGEEIDTTTGEHLGNFPQAFTHLALIEAVSLLIASELEQDVKSAGWDPNAVGFGCLTGCG